MTSKTDDDYAARVYISFVMPASELSFLTRAKLMLARSIYGDVVPDAAINYVWDNRYPVGTRKPNVYTDRVRMNVAESGAAHAGKGGVARHDVQQDMIAEFGSEQARLIQLADRGGYRQYRRACPCRIFRFSFCGQGNRLFFRLKR